jgi:peptidoglycan/LPS O-acetylase OafA/YrhL
MPGSFRLADEPTLPGMNASPTPRIRYRTLEAWRGVACLAVLLFHSLGPYQHEPFWPALEPVRAVAGHGWTGLHLFFVISGYCIFERLRLALATGETPAEFIVDRAWRILPTYWVVLGLNHAVQRHVARP